MDSLPYKFAMVYTILSVLFVLYFIDKSMITITKSLTIDVSFLYWSLLKGDITITNSHLIELFYFVTIL